MATKILKAAGSAAWGLRKRTKLVGTGVAALGAAGTAVLARRRLADRVDLPDPGPLALATALSVHNAAKGTVIAAIREADAPDEAAVSAAVSAAVVEGTRAGADVTAVAIGAVEGAAEVAHLVGSRPARIAALAARYAVEAAEAQGLVAAGRVREVLSAYL